MQNQNSQSYPSSLSPRPPVQDAGPQRRPPFELSVTTSLSSTTTTSTSHLPTPVSGSSNSAIQPGVPHSNPTSPLDATRRAISISSSTTSHDHDHETPNTSPESPSKGNPRCYRLPSCRSRTSCINDKTNGNNASMGTTPVGYRQLQQEVQVTQTTPRPASSVLSSQVSNYDYGFPRTKSPIPIPIQNQQNIIREPRLGATQNQQGVQNQQMQPPPPPQQINMGLAPSQNMAMTASNFHMVQQQQQQQRTPQTLSSLLPPNAPQFGPFPQPHQQQSLFLMQQRQQQHQHQHQQLLRQQSQQQQQQQQRLLQQQQQQQQQYRHPQLQGSHPQPQPQQHPHPQSMPPRPHPHPQTQQHPQPLLPPQTIPQTVQTVPQPQPQPQPPPPHAVSPQIHHLVSQTLLPAQSLLEQAWSLTSTRVLSEMSKMHSHYTSLHAHALSLSSELNRVRKEVEGFGEERRVWRREEGRLGREVGEGKREVERLEGVVGRLGEECNLARGVRVRMQWEMGQLREEVEGLRKKAGGGVDGGGGEGEREYPSEVVDAVRKEMSEKLEIQVACLLAEAQDQKSKRFEAERKLAEVQQQLRAIANVAGDAMTEDTTPTPTPTLPTRPRPPMIGGDRDRSGSDTSMVTVVGTPPFGWRVHPPMMPKYIECGGLGEGERGEGGEGGGADDAASALINLSSGVRKRGVGLGGFDAEGGGEGDLRPSKRVRVDEVRVSGDDGVVVKEEEVEEEEEDMDLESMKKEEVELLLQHPPLDADAEEEEEDSGNGDTSPVPVKRRGIGISHIDLLYKSSAGDRMVCRMCLLRRQHAGSTEAAVSFGGQASWEALLGHCRAEHHDACEELEKLSPSQVVELRQRLKVM